MSRSRAYLKASSKGPLDPVMPAPRASVSVGKDVVRAYSASRDGKSIDPRRDPAYHNRMLFAGSLAAAFPKP